MKSQKSVSISIVTLNQRRGLYGNGYSKTKCLRLVKFLGFAIRHDSINCSVKKGIVQSDSESLRRFGYVYVFGGLSTFVIDSAGDCMRVFIDIFILPALHLLRKLRGHSMLLFDFVFACCFMDFSRRVN